MLKKTALLLTILALSACTLHNVTDKQELCDQSKRQQVFNATEPSYNSSYLTSDQKHTLDSTAQTSCS